MVTLPTRGIRHLRRFRQIAEVFIRHGFGELVEVLEVLPVASVPRRLLRRLWPATPRLGTPRRLRIVLEELGPTFVKLGQVLSTRPDLLPPDYVAELARLRDDVPPGPWEPVRTQIEEELGAPLEDLFASFDPEPLAAASLAQVHPATLLDGTAVVVKVQRPGIREVIETDLEILFDVTRLLQVRTPLGAIYDLPGIAEEFAATLRAELDFYREGHNADRFRANFAGETYLHIPAVHWDLTTRRVLVLERIHGVRIDEVEALDEAGHDRERVALHATRMVVKEILEDGFFHADPHPGNFVVMDDEVIGAMDFGMVGYLSRRDRTDLIRLYVYAVQLDEVGVVDQLIRMGMVGGQVDEDGLRRDVGRLLRKYQGLPLKAIRAGEVLQEAMPVAFRHRLRLPAELWLVGKTMAMMEGVGLKLYPDFDPFAVSEPFVRRFVLQLASPREWGPSLLRGASDWGLLMRLLPRVGARLLTQAERGELEVTLRHKELEQALGRLDRLANRISLSLLLSALIVGLALLVPAFRLVERGGLTTALVILGFFGVSLLGIWLILSILRSGRR
jgi:ubiquinone biosynthesis protein